MVFFYHCRCCCYHKGTNFQANHNTAEIASVNFRVVVATTKVRIFKQITTYCIAINHVMLLLLLPQRYEFSSKSQRDDTLTRLMSVVVATTKVRIFKQITTKANNIIFRYMLLLLPQRYEFSSKSQQILVILLLMVSCCCYHKGTNFQANHNKFLKAVVIVPVVVATTKVRIFKQITTEILRYFNLHMLLLLPQRYEFSSKSQPSTPMIEPSGRCCCYHKGTNFQANHNVHRISNGAKVVVVATTKVRIFKQITTR